MSEMKTLYRDRDFLRGQTDAYGKMLLKHPQIDDIREEFENACVCLRAVQREIQDYQTPDETQ